MEGSIDFVTIATAFGTAIYAAVGLDYLTLEEFGLPLQLVSRGAVLVALIIGLFVAIEVFRPETEQGQVSRSLIPTARSRVIRLDDAICLPSSLRSEDRCDAFHIRLLCLHIDWPGLRLKFISTVNPTENCQ